MLGVPNGSTPPFRTRSAVSSASRSSACSRASPSQLRLRVVAMRWMCSRTAWWNGLVSALSAMARATSCAFRTASSSRVFARWNSRRTTAWTTFSRCCLVVSIGITPASQSF